MAKKRTPRDSSFYTRQQAEEERLGQRRYNQGARIWEVFGGTSTWDVAIPKEIENVGSETLTAPTTNPSRPRALTIAYNPEISTLVVVFRDNTWWQYNNVPAHMWVGLKNSSSTGKFLREEGLDTWPDMGPASMDILSEGVKAQISQSAQTASDIQNSNTAVDKVINVRSFSDEEMYKDYL